MPGRAESVTADFGVEAGSLRAPADHPPGVDAMHQVRHFAGAAASGAE